MRFLLTMLPHGNLSCYAVLLDGISSMNGISCVCLKPSPVAVIRHGSNETRPPFTASKKSR